jgi:hypothetical protein
MQNRGQGSVGFHIAARSRALAMEVRLDTSDGRRRLKCTVNVGCAAVLQDERPFVSAKKVMSEMGEPYKSGVELLSFHTVSKVRHQPPWGYIVLFGHRLPDRHSGVYTNATADHQQVCNWCVAAMAVSHGESQLVLLLCRVLVVSVG